MTFISNFENILDKSVAKRGSGRSLLYKHASILHSLRVSFVVNIGKLLSRNISLCD